MTAPFVEVQQLSYTSHPQITMSDHRPVSADFTVDVNYILGFFFILRIVDGSFLFRLR
jgi:hypothetical protein